MQALINEYLVDGDEAVAARLAATVNSNNLLELVGLLGDYLVQDDDKIRERATKCLADTLKYTDWLNRQQIQVLTSFFTERLDDPASVVYVCRGIEVLLRLSNFSKPDADAVLDKLSQIKARELPQAKRQAVFELLHALEPLKSVKFVSTFVDIASAEKDPQNLVISLRISQKILDKYTLSEQERQDMFDITFCYFPVTFTPPKNMAYKISADDIKLLLQNALVSPVIADLTVPALIGKLTAVSVTTKTESLETLSLVLAKLSEFQLASLWMQVWDGVKFEVLHGTPETDTYAPALRVLRQLVPQGQEFVTAVRAEFPNLSSHKLGPQVAHLIVGVTDGYPEIFEELAGAALESILGGSADELNMRVPSIVVFLQSPYPCPASDLVLSVLLAAMTGDADYANLAVEGLGLLAKQNVEFAPLIVQKLTEVVQTERLRNVTSRTLLILAPHRNDLMQSICLPTLLSQMDDEWTEKVENLFKVLADITVTKEMVQTLTVRLYNRAASITSTAYLAAALRTLVTVAGRLSVAELSGYYRSVFPLFREFVHSSHVPAFQDDLCVEKAAELAEITGRGVPQSAQPDYTASLCTLFLDKALVLGPTPTNLMGLYVSSIAAMKKAPSRAFSFVDMVDTLGRSQNVYVRSGYLRFVALAANKWTGLFGDMRLYVQWLQECISTDGRNKLTSLELLAWLTRGLVLRNDSQGFRLASYFIELLASPTVGQFAARVFGILLLPDRLLAKENGVIVRRLYRQRLFTEQLHALIEGAKTPHKVNYMIALSSLLRYTPSSALIPHLSEIVPIVLESMQIRHEPVQLAAIGAILVTLKDAGSIFSPHLNTIVTQTLELAQDGNNSIAVRTTSLSLLAQMATVLGSTAMEPYRRQVVSQLVTILDDPNRAVRKQAVRCRQAYYV